MATVQQRHRSVYILYDDALLENANAIDFDAVAESVNDRSGSTSELEANRAGRGAVRCFDHAGMTLVLRHYHRGGMIANVVNDTYCWTGIERTRAWREFRLLSVMYAQGLPVPRPVAVRVNRSAFGYRADIVTKFVAGAQTLAELLTKRTLVIQDWRAIGAMLKRFHTQGIWHADLNAHNILADNNGRWYLIDFDRGAKRLPNRRWQLANLQRLQRSLQKLFVQRVGFNFGDAEWGRLMSGYDSVR